MTQWREGKETTATMVLQNVFIFGKNTVTLENLKQWISKTAATIIIYTYTVVAVGNE